MTEQTLDARLQAILLNGLRQEFGTMDDAAEADFSPRFRKQMAKMVADPRGWYKRKSRPVWQQMLRTAASIALVLMLSFAVVLAAVPTARAAVFGWIKDRYENYFVFRFDDESSEMEGPLFYRPTWIPEGYAEFLVDETGNLSLLAYKNEAGDLLTLGYINNQAGANWFIDVSQAEITKVTVNGVPAELMISKDPDVASGIAWSTNTTAFYINGFVDRETLIAIAESVVMVEIDPNGSATE